VDTPFVLELRGGRRGDLRALADALARSLAARHVGVRLDGQPRYAGEPRVDVTTAERDQPGVSLVVGVRAPDGQPLWLSPLDLPEAPEEAASAAVGFLERWGFVAMAPAPAAAAPERATGAARPSVA
jgi:hypothetical protein